MVIRALNVHSFNKAAFKFAQVIGNIRHEISVVAVLLAHHTIFVIAEFFEIGCAEPKSAVLLIGVTGSNKRVDCSFHQTVRIQRAFQVEIVKSDAKSIEVTVLFIFQVTDREGADTGFVIDITAGGDYLTVTGFNRFAIQKVFGNVFDVKPLIAIFRKDNAFALKFFDAQTDRIRQRLNLYAGIVVIKLAADVPTLGLH